MSDNGATTTQGQSIPTALFEKMFGKDNGMPGRDELLSTMQDRSESSAKYKVGERVKFVDEDCVISGVTETLTGRWRYNIERNGVCIAVGVTENMLDPADEDKAP